LVCVICVAMFIHQEYSCKAYSVALDEFCEEEGDGLFSEILAAQEEGFCQKLFSHVRISAKPIAALSDISKNIAVVDNEGQETPSAEQILNTLKIEYARFEKSVPVDVTTQWWFEPQNLDYKRMITSSLSHADWEHLAFNLVFFFAFSVSAELLLGSMVFLAVLLLSCITTSLLYSFGAFGFDSSLPTLGLSGVVTTMMAMMAVIFPHKHVRVFYWFIVLAGVFRMPLLILAAFYIGMDIYGMAKIVEDSNVNYLSHLGGAATGAVVAALYLLFNWSRANKI
jgi:membrane associated rhomboid family serine protease